MMRLADCLLRWTGDLTYADYWERNLYNGILAQQCGPAPDYEDRSMFAGLTCRTGWSHTSCPSAGYQALGDGRQRTSGAATARSSRPIPGMLSASTIRMPTASS